WASDWACARAHDEQKMSRARKTRFISVAQVGLTCALFDTSSAQVASCACDSRKLTTCATSEFALQGLETRNMMRVPNKSESKRGCHHVSSTRKRIRPRFSGLRFSCRRRRHHAGHALTD